MESYFPRYYLVFHEEAGCRKVVLRPCFYSTRGSNTSWRHLPAAVVNPTFSVVMERFTRWSVAKCIEDVNAEIVVGVFVDKWLTIGLEIAVFRSAVSTTDRGVECVVVCMYVVILP